jgi:hypothetical protein
MRLINSVPALLAAFAMSQSFADEPSPSPAAPAATAPATSAAATAATAAAAADAAKAADLEAQTKKMKALGYKPEVQNGQTVYCRREQVLGTRFDKKMCGTAEDLARQAEQSKEQLEHVQRQGAAVPRSG